MRRPKDSKNPKSGGDDKSPPGGRARDRLDQFNRQRGLPTDPVPKEAPSNETQKPPGKSKP
jgi:hypothetical protein